MYHYGQGVPQNQSVAKEWFSKACHNGSQQGCDAYQKLDQTGY
jgi:sel1 repeat protein (fragment)